MPEDEFRVSPPWKHALRALLDRNLNNGDVITKRELVSLFGLSEPVTARDQEQFSLEFMRQFSDLRDELLEEHRIALRTMHGESSYEVVPPASQTALALADGDREIRRALRKMTRTLVFIRHEELTDEQRRQNADSQAKAAMLAGMVRGQRLLPRPG